MNNSQLSQHKRLAMGQSINGQSSGSGGKFAKGGSVAAMKTGLPTSPITDAKRANGIPGLKKGGKSC